MFEVKGGETIRANCSGGLGSLDGVDDRSIVEGGKGRVERDVVEASDDFAGARVGAVRGLGSELLAEFVTDGGVLGASFVVLEGDGWYVAGDVCHRVS